MKDKIYNPASTNEPAPAKGMGAVNTFNSEEIEDREQRTGDEGIPKNFENNNERGQTDDTVPIVPRV